MNDPAAAEPQEGEILTFAANRLPAATAAASAIGHTYNQNGRTAHAPLPTLAHFMLINLINNIAFLVALVAAGQLVVSRYQKRPLNRQLLLGLLFGGVTLLGMLNPVNFAPGLIFDGRAIILAVAGVVGGGVTAAIAAAMAAVYRYQLGGTGAIVGIVVAVQSAGLGVLARVVWRRYGIDPHFAHYLGLGVAVQAAQLAAFTQLPDRAGYAFIEQAWWVLMLCYPLATMLLCQIFRDQEIQLANRAAWQAAQEAALRDRVVLRTLIDTLPDLVWLKDPHGVYLACNRRFEQFFGAREQDIVGKTDDDFVDRAQADLFRAHDRAAMQNDGPSVNEEEIVFAVDAHRELSRTTKTPMRGADGRVIGVLGIAHDITAMRQQETALRESRENLNRAQSVAHIGSWTMDIGSGQLAWSDETCRIFGLATGTAMGIERFLERVHPADRAHVASAWKTALAGGADYDIVHRIDAAGETRWVRERALFERGPDGTPRRGIGTVQDITERKLADERLQRSEARFRELVESIPGFAYRCQLDAQWTMDYFSPGFAALTGHAIDDFIDNRVRSYASIIHPDDVAAVDRTVREGVARRQPYELEYRIADARGNTLWVGERGCAHFGTDGKPDYLIGVIFDISARKRNESELARHRNHLQELVAEQTRDLRIAKEAAETANIAKSAFLANMSHEIRTPLNAIGGMAHLLRRSGLTAQQSDKLDKIEAASSHLLATLNAVLDLSKIEAGKFVLEDAPVNVEHLLDNIAAMLSGKAKEKGIAIERETVAIAHPLRGDPTRLQQALLNYAANALKFTDHGRIVLRVREETHTDATVTLRFEVEDSGIGIAPGVLPKLFVAFEQADNSTTRQYGGTGLGLAITQKIAEIMGGTAGAHSREGEGSTFWFTAVLRKAAPSPVADSIPVENAEQTLRRHHAGKRILLAEDEPINREIALMLLEDVGLAVELAEDGAAAVAKVAAAAYDLILMDMQMPLLDGLDATRQIHRLAGRAHIPILAMTANAFAEDKQRCFAAGMDDFIAKPVTPAALYAIVLKWLDRGER